jgi:hypothetical protein
MLKKLPLIIALPLMSMMGGAPASGEESYSYEEQEACTGDAFRLCADKIPDIPRITACMEAKRDQLSPKCAKMFSGGHEHRPNEGGSKPYHDKPFDEHHDNMD